MLQDPFGNPTFLTSNTSNPTIKNAVSCQADVGTGNASSGIISRSWGEPLNPGLPMAVDPASDLSGYDYTVLGSTAFVIAVFAKEGSPDANPSPSLPQGFSDIRMLCISPDEIQPGSRVVTNASGSLRSNLGCVLLLVFLLNAHLL
jgi:hypothetical protein